MGSAHLPELTARGVEFQFSYSITLQHTGISHLIQSARISITQYWGCKVTYDLCTTVPLNRQCKTTKLILLDSLLQEIGDACLPPPPLVKWIRQTVFQIKSRQNVRKNEQWTGAAEQLGAAGVAEQRAAAGVSEQRAAAGAAEQRAAAGVSEQRAAAGVV
jgi:hypothetical protein